MLRKEFYLLTFVVIYVLLYVCWSINGGWINYFARDVVTNDIYVNSMHELVRVVMDKNVTILYGSFNMARYDIDKLQRYVDERESSTKNVFKWDDRYYCEWCSENSCIRGVMYSILYYERVANLHNMQAKDFKTMNKKMGIKSSIRGKFEVLRYKCVMREQLPMHVIGMLTIPLIEDGNDRRMTVATHVKYVKPVRKKRNRGLVCGRPLYGRISANMIKLFVTYYNSLGLDVVIYDAGIGYIHEKWKLNELMRTHLLMILDIRDYVQLLYGWASHYPMMAQRGASQMLVKPDCHFWARERGYEWTLNVDLDEYISFGIDSTESIISNLPDWLSSRGEYDWYSFGSMIPTNYETFKYDWNMFQEYNYDALLEYEWPEKEKYFYRCKDDNYELCLNSYGSRKVAIKTSVDPWIVFMHRVSKSSHVKGIDLNVKEIYLRHYRELNNRTRLPESIFGDILSK